MIKYYKLDKTFGPVGTIAGATLFVVGIITLIYSIAGFFLIILGAFVGFTGTGTYIDIENRRVKHITKLFGIFSVGNWITLNVNSLIEIKKSNIDWRTYSRGNRTLDISNGEFYIILINGKTSIPLMKVSTIETARIEVEKINKSLGLS